MALDLRQNQRDSYYNQQDHSVDDRSEYGRNMDDNRKSNEEEHDGSADNYIGNTVHQWDAPEFETYEKSGRWYLIAGSLVAAMVIYALATNSPIMAITFILIGIVGYIQLQRDPRMLTFRITTEGILAGKELYRYENIASFWIFYEPHQMKVISLYTKAKAFPYVHIPVHDEDPVVLRKHLMEFIPEVKQDPNLIDALERFLHI